MDILALHMNTVKFIVPFSEIHDVIFRLKKNGVKYYPIRKMDNGYRIEINDEPIASYFLIKYG